MKICWRRDRLPTPIFLGFSCSSAVKQSACNVGDLDSIPGLGRSPGEGKGYLPQYSGLENSMGCIVQGVPKTWTQLNEFHFHFIPLSMIISSPVYVAANGTSSFFMAELYSIVYTPFHLLHPFICQWKFL